MDKDAVLQFVKKNAFALACGAVAIAAAVLLFYPLGGWEQELREKATQEAGHYSTVGGFTSRPRHWPKFSPTETGPTLDLTLFPNTQQVESGKAAVEALTRESQAAYDFLVKMNDHTNSVLVKRLLPKPEQDALKFQFADVYRKVLSQSPTESGIGSPEIPPPVQGNPKAIEPMPKDDRLAQVSAKNLFNDVLQAGQPADKELVEQRLGWLRENVFAPKLVTVNGKTINSADVAKEFGDAAKLVPDQLAEEIAAKKKIYVDRDAFAYEAAFLPGVATGNPDTTAIWWAQQALWLQSDIAQAIADINTAAANAPAAATTAPPTTGPTVPRTGIPVSPVKRILKLELSAAHSMYRNPPAGTGGAGGAGGTLPGTANETQDHPPAYSVSPTGRTSNAMYDVVPFYLTIDVDANRINEVLAGLTRGRLIYIGNQNFHAVDADALKPQGYLYGSGPVVRLTLAGEELFLRKWTTDLMPDPIKVHLGLMHGSPGQTGAGPGGPGVPTNNMGQMSMPGMGGE